MEARVLRLVLQHTEADMFGVCRSVGRAWRDCVDALSTAVYVAPVQDAARAILALSQQTLLSRSGSGNKVKARVEFLEATLHLLLQWDLPVLGHVKLWRLLCGELLKALAEAHAVLVERDELNENFDVYELTLRRYYQNIGALVCVHTQQNACDGIVDSEARLVWETRFGAKRSYVSWGLFSTLLTSEASKRPVKFLVNFPDDGIISVYKFDLLVRLFGPSFRDVERNIRDHACGSGFAGIINRIHARALLMSHWKRVGQSWYLIRLSRTEPEFLVFSHIDTQGQVGHSLHVKGSLLAKVRRMRERYSCLPVRLLPEVHENTSLRAYATYNSGYCTIASSDEEADDGDESRCEDYARGEELQSVAVAAAPAPAVSVAAAAVLAPPIAPAIVVAVMQPAPVVQQSSSSSSSSYSAFL